MDETMVIRPYTDADRDTLADLWVAAWRVTLPSIDFFGRRPWIIGQLDSQHATETVTLCADTEDGTTFGFAMIEPARNWLEQLAVHPAHFGAGAARRLLQAAKELCPKTLSLRVNQDNSRAVRFYRRENFEIVAEGTNPGGTLKTWDMTWRAAG